MAIQECLCYFSHLLVVQFVFMSLYLCGPGKSQLVNIHMCSYGSTGCRPHTRQNVHNTFWKSNLT